MVPEHFHLTEIGEITKRFIDCGGVVREKKSLSMQLRCADDFDHRLSWLKLLQIIAWFRKKITAEDYDVVIEYQWKETLWLYDVEWDDDNQMFVLMPQSTTCLAMDKCGIA